MVPRSKFGAGLKWQICCLRSSSVEKNTFRLHNKTVELLNYVLDLYSIQQST